MTGFIESVIVLAVGVGWAIRRGERVWRDVSSATLAIAVLALVESAIGFFSMFAAGGAASDTHRWLAHILVLTVWCFAGLTGAAALQSILRRPVIAIASVAFLVLLLGLIVLESLTGYLSEVAQAGGPGAEETRKRFYVLHCLALPCFTIAAATAGGLILRQAYRRHASEGAGGPAQQLTSDNPYAPPSGK